MIFRTASSMLALLLAAAGCSNNADSQNRDRGELKPVPPVVTPEFTAYWNQGKGEITRYALEQARYGEMRKGNAVLIFVTEDFLGDRQVKLESPPTGKDVVPILKANITKKFNTGIYPYSMMTSVFSPIDVAYRPHALKVTTSSQEWCGQTYSQMNLRGGLYNLEQHSYFEKEGDEERSLDAVTLEDEIWTRIRLSPATLPSGDIRIIPGTMTSRLRHIPLAVENATATLAPLGVDSTFGQLMRYTLHYKGSERTLAIDFQQTFPHRIMGWSESYKDGFGPQPVLLTTRAVRTNELMIDYWAKHSIADDSLRVLLGLEEPKPAR